MKKASPTKLPMPFATETVFEPVREEILSPERFLAERGKLTRNVKRFRIIPPGKGRGDYGKIQVEYEIPVLRPVAPSCRVS